MRTQGLFQIDCLPRLCGSMKFLMLSKVVGWSIFHIHCIYRVSLCVDSLMSNGLMNCGGFPLIAFIEIHYGTTFGGRVSELRLKALHLYAECCLPTESKLNSKLVSADHTLGNPFSQGIPICVSKIDLTDLTSELTLFSLYSKSPSLV